MKTHSRLSSCRSRSVLAALNLGIASALPSLAATPLSPGTLALSPNRESLYVACETASRIVEVDPTSGEVKATIPVPPKPLGLTLNRSGSRLFVTSAGPRGTVSVVDTAKAVVLDTLDAGYDAMAPRLSPDEKTLYLCNRFDHEIQIIDLETGSTKQRVSLPREPVAMDITPDGKLLVVANHLPVGPSNAAHVAAVVSLVSTMGDGEVRNLILPNGSTLSRGVAISPDGNHAAVTHLLGRYHLPTTQIERGWIHTNALTLIDLREGEILNTVLLDSIDRGTANPWAVAWSQDGARLVVTHAGTHELSVIDAPGLLAKLAALPAESTQGTARAAADVPNDLAFLQDLRRRISLLPDKGPRSVALTEDTAYVGNFFADTLSAVDLAAERPKVRSLPLGPQPKMDLRRRGELAWNDATLCFQGWLSCSSCHSSDARVDGLNWDNLNDGIGNPKNAKSLILSFQTPPTTALGVRENAHVSVRAGIRHALFTAQPDDVALSLDEYLSRLKPMPSPHLVEGELSPAARRGRKLFQSEAVGCADCHPAPLHTDMKFHNVGTIGPLDQPTDRFDTPTLVESWRSGPYLHDGSAVTIRDVLTTRNPQGKHGDVDHLTDEELDDLCEYILSL